ncbi:hypothetical protein GCM10022243_66740 [Saccharothrix violaceirubra]
MAVRDAQLAFPVAEGHYASGSDATVVVTIVNNGVDLDKLVSVTSAEAGEGVLEGDVQLEPGTAIKSEADGASGHATSSSSAHATTSAHATSESSAHSTTTGSAAPTTASSGKPSSSASSARPTTTTAAKAEPGTVKIVLKGLRKDVRPGETVAVAFLFEKGGQVVLQVPIGATPEARVEGKSEH